MTVGGAHQTSELRIMNIAGGFVLTSDEDMDDAAARLESALERIATLAQRPAPFSPVSSDAPTGEIAGRLDGLIDRLRAELAAPRS
jgi:hypothetical protein